MNRLSIERRTQVISALVEGSSIRSTERMFDVHRDTVMRLLVEVGTGCAKIMDAKMRNLNCTRLECDEIWSFVGKKQKMLNRDKKEYWTKGDQWIWVGFDPDSKLVPSYRVGKRDRENAVLFMNDLASRVANRVQINTDALGSYNYAIENAFGADADHAQVVKFYDAVPVGPGRYAPPKVSSVEKTAVFGSPDLSLASTSGVERNNLTMRTSMHRLTRLSLGFSKKLENLMAATALHFANYNLVRQHGSISVTPAMAAGVEKRMWSLEELVEETSR